MHAINVDMQLIFFGFEYIYKYVHIKINDKLENTKATTKIYDIYHFGLNVKTANACQRTMFYKMTKPRLRFTVKSFVLNFVHKVAQCKLCLSLRLKVKSTGEWLELMSTNASVLAYSNKDNAGQWISHMYRSNHRERADLSLDILFYFWIYHMHGFACNDCNVTKFVDLHLDVDSHIQIYWITHNAL